MKTQIALADAGISYADERKNTAFEFWMSKP